MENVVDLLKEIDSSTLDPDVKDFLRKSILAFFEGKPQTFHDALLADAAGADK